MQARWTTPTQLVYINCSSWQPKHTPYFLRPWICDNPQLGHHHINIHCDWNFSFVCNVNYFFFFPPISLCAIILSVLWFAVTDSEGLLFWSFSLGSVEAGSVNQKTIKPKRYGEFLGGNNDHGSISIVLSPGINPLSEIIIVLNTLIFFFHKVNNWSRLLTILCWFVSPQSCVSAEN